MTTSRPTIHDVAAKAGVSKSLVSLALSGSSKVSPESKEKIVQAADAIGYRPNAAARSLAARKSRTVGILVLDLHNPVFAEILDGVQSQLRDKGFNSMLVAASEDPTREKSEIDTMLQFQIDGLILISYRMNAKELKELAREVPIVTVTRDDIQLPSVDTVSNDDVAGAELAVNYLVSLGHSKIVCLDGGDTAVSLARAKGYENAMKNHGLQSKVKVVKGGLTDAAGYAAANEALNLKPTALFVVNDIAALGAIAAIEEHGMQVPEDISVVGYDGIRLGGLRSINLTSVAQPLAELGRISAQHLLERIENPKLKSRRTTVASHLVVRGTTRAI